MSPAELGVLAVIAVLVVAWAQASPRGSSGPDALTVTEAPLERLDASLLVFSVHPGSRLAGVSVAELRLPPGGIPALIHRDGRLVRATDITLVRVGDHLLIAAAPQQRNAVRDRLRAVSRSGRLAGWYGDDGAGKAAPIWVVDPMVVPSNLPKTCPTGPRTKGQAMILDTLRRDIP